MLAAAPDFTARRMYGATLSLPAMTRCTGLPCFARMRRGADERFGVLEARIAGEHEKEDFVAESKLRAQFVAVLARWSGRESLEDPRHCKSRAFFRREDGAASANGVFTMFETAMVIAPGCAYWRRSISCSSRWRFGFPEREAPPARDAEQVVLPCRERGAALEMKNVGMPADAEIVDDVEIVPRAGSRSSAVGAFHAGARHRVRAGGGDAEFGDAEGWNSKATTWTSIPFFLSSCVNCHVHDSRPPLRQSRRSRTRATFIGTGGCGRKSLRLFTTKTPGHQGKMRGAGHAAALAVGDAPLREAGTFTGRNGG